jgi:hypothetical protein
LKALFHIGNTLFQVLFGQLNLLDENPLFSTQTPVWDKLKLWAASVNKWLPLSGTNFAGGMSAHSEYVMVRQGSPVLVEGLGLSWTPACAGVTT